jgi:hypothetical protein
MIPKYLSRPLGKEVQTTTFVDANLFHDMISRQLVTGILHLLYKKHIDWYSKLQSSKVATATFGSKYVVARTTTKHIIDIRNTLRYLGVPVRGMLMLFSNNKQLSTLLPFYTSTLSCTSDTFCCLIIMQRKQLWQESLDSTTFEGSSIQPTSLVSVGTTPWFGPW